MATWILTLIVPFILACLWHGISLQIAAVLGGEEAPRFTRAIWVSWLGGLLGGGTATLWTYTFGIFVSLFVSSWLSWAIGIALLFFVTGAVYKRGLRFTGPAALGVAGIHLLLSFGLTALISWLSYSVF